MMLHVLLLNKYSDQMFLVYLYRLEAPMKLCVLRLFRPLTMATQNWSLYIGKR